MLYVLGLALLFLILYVVIYVVLISTVGVVAIQLLKYGLFVLGLVGVGYLIGNLIVKLIHK